MDVGDDFVREFFSYGTGGTGRPVELPPVDEAETGPSPAGQESSIGWLKTLGGKLTARAAELVRYDAYYRGAQGRRFTASKWRPEFGDLFERYAENFCGLVVDAVEERLDVEGFRFPPQASTAARPADLEAGDRGDPDEREPGTADADAWRIWQDNGLDARSQIAHTEALVKGVVYVLVSPFENERIAGRSPRITIEDPLQTIVEYRPGGDERVIGMKRWWDPGERLMYATLYFPDRIEKWQASGTARDRGGRFTSASDPNAHVTPDDRSWEPRRVAGEDWPLANVLGVVPLIPLVNRPRLVGEGESEICQVVPIQDAINKLAIDGLVASDVGAFRQKWASGIEIPIDPDTKRPVEGFKPDIDRIIATSVPDAKFGTFEATELENYVKAIDQKVTSIASITRTPYHYFLQHGGQPPSGESLKSSETGLVRKTRRKQRHFGEGWEEVIRLAFAALEDPRAQVLNSVTVWANPESQTEAQHIDALIKRRSGLKVPLRQLWEDAGYTPVVIATFMKLLKQEAAMLTGTLVEPDLSTADQTQSQTRESFTP